MTKGLDYSFGGLVAEEGRGTAISLVLEISRLEGCNGGGGGGGGTSGCTRRRQNQVLELPADDDGGSWY
jgi:hypothetical protein